ncbi:MAG: cysteate synthase [Pirellulaceae bacterium]|nr:cysteate synthase [Pirellulaceae bacterium]
MMTSHYSLVCTACGATYDGEPGRLTCDADHEPALLRARYASRQLHVDQQRGGLFRFRDWLPICRELGTASGPRTFVSEHLGPLLGLDHLVIVFNGYWPERGAETWTTSFKELEAATAAARYPAGHRQTMVVASAGNTARAFAHVYSADGSPVCLVVPERRLGSLWSLGPLSDDVELVAVTGDSDYFDAIRLAGSLCQQPGFFPEGGALNVARRDGMGTTVLSGATLLGRIPDHYFQAVGSGTGGIAAWEANLRLIEDGRFGTTRMQLHLAQNVPFTPMVDAWQQGLPEIPDYDEADLKRRLNGITAKVLSNRRPAYAIRGGLFDALQESQGKMYAVTNQEASSASLLFEHAEGIDINAESAVATAALMQAVARGTVRRRETILLNITGGGERRLRRDQPGIQPIPVTRRVALVDVGCQSCLRSLAESLRVAAAE